MQFGNLLKKGTDRSTLKRRRSVLCEALENRQLLSVTVDVRAAGGAKSVAVSSVGQVLQLEAWATITGKNNDPTQDGLWDLSGSFLSNGFGAGSIGGNLTAMGLAPFDLGYSGRIQDLNGDGHLDVGSVAGNSGSSDFFGVRAASMQDSTTPGAVAANGSLAFKFATLTYTVTSLGQGGETDIVYLPTDSTNNLDVVYKQDNTSTSPSGRAIVGAPLVITDPAIAPAPVANNVAIYVKQNTASKITPLAFDTSVGSLVPTSLTVTTSPTHGNAVLQADGSLLYTPTTNFTGVDSLSYKISDAEGHTSNIATVTINVGTVAPPVAGSVSTSVPLGGSVNVNVLSSATAASGLTINSSSVKVVTAPHNGTAVVQNNGTVLYTPRHGFLGIDTFGYTVADSQGHVSNVGTASITVFRTVPPVAGNIVAVAPNTTTTLIDVLPYATAATGLTIDPTTVRITYHSAHGTAVALANGSIAYTPTPGYTGQDIVQYTIRDSNGVESTGVYAGGSGPSEIDISVQGAVTIAKDFSTSTYAGNGAAQIMVYDYVSASAGSSLNIFSLQASIEQPSHGTVDVFKLFNGTNAYNIYYTPQRGFLGTEIIDYSIADTNGQRSNVGHITVTVKPGQPTGVTDTAQTTSGKPVVINVLANDYVNAVSTLVPSSVKIGTPPLHGTAVAQSDGTVIYTPASDFVGDDTFDYTFTDSLKYLGGANVNINVKPALLTGTVIGTAGSYQNHGATIANVFDNNFSTYFDAPSANGNWVGLDLGTATAINKINYAPRAGFAIRMVGGAFQASNDPTFKTGVVSLASITSTPPINVFSTVQVSVTGAYRYVRYLSPAGSFGNVADIQFYGIPSTSSVSPLTGTTIGTPGSYQNKGNTLANAFDGNTSSFFDGASANDNWAGLDLGSAKTISQISFAPRAGFSSRMINGIFQASNSADFSTGVVNLYTITSAPPQDVLTTVSTNIAGSFRYVRYLSPTGSYGNISEMVFYG